MRHISFKETAEWMAQNEWGHNEKDEEKFAEGLKVDASAAVLLAVLNKLQNIGEALRFEEPEKKRERPEGAIKIPGAKIGDVFYDCSTLEEGASPSVVAGFDDEGFPQSVYLWDGGATVCWFYEGGDAKTETEALRREAEYDIDYHAPRLALAQLVLKSKDPVKLIGEGIDFDDPEVCAKLIAAAKE